MPAMGAVPIVPTCSADICHPMQPADRDSTTLVFLTPNVIRFCFELPFVARLLPVAAGSHRAMLAPPDPPPPEVHA